jgi:hypothetical protein
VQNNLTELYSLLKLADTKHFDEDGVVAFCQKYENKLKDPKVEVEFRAIFEKYCLRRTKGIIQYHLLSGPIYYLIYYLKIFSTKFRLVFVVIDLHGFIFNFLACV